MAKFIQVCASQIALFALDEEGDFYPYHFNWKTSVTLVATGESEEKSTSGGPWAAAGRRAILFGEPALGGGQLVK